MAEKVLMIALSPTMEEGRISSWKVKEGDTVKNGTILCEIETDKAVMEYESPFDGTLLKIVLEAGAAAKIGDLIAIVGKPGEDVSALAAAVPAAGKATAKPAVPPETKDKPASAAAVPPGEPAKKPAEPAPAAAVAEPVPAARTSPADGAVRGFGGYPKSSPLARNLARAKGLDLRSIAGSGPEGRVVKRDVERYAPEAAGGTAGGKTQEAPRETAKPVQANRSVPVSGMRAAIARRLSESAFTAPHFFLRTAVGMDALLDARARINERAAGKLSLNAFFMKFAAEALKRHPRVNSSWKGRTIELFGSIDIGLAVALPDGLITPVVRDCGAKGIAEIDRELAALIDKAKGGALKPEEYTGATFSISNLGTYGIEEFTAIINPPGSAILALGAVVKEPVVLGDEIAVRRRMRMTLSCDHRTIDGAVGAAFLRDLTDMVEDPARALV